MEQKLIEIQNKSVETLQNHFAAVISTSAEYVREMEENANKLKRANDDLEATRQKIAKLEADNTKLQKDLQDAKALQHKCASCEKKCLQYCMDCLK